MNLNSMAANWNHLAANLAPTKECSLYRRTKQSHNKARHKPKNHFPHKIEVPKMEPNPPPPTAAPPPYPPQPPYPHQLLQQQHHQHQQNQLNTFWTHQRQEIESATDFKNHQLPLARIKKIMKADEDVRMISAEAPVLFAKACELFILELTIRSWLHAEENKRRTLQKNDIAAAITRTDIFDFLVDIVPREEIIEEEGGGFGLVGDNTVGGVPYYYPPIGQPAVGPGMYMQPPPSQAWQSVWQTGAGDDGAYGGGGSGGQGNLDGQGFAIFQVVSVEDFLHVQTRNCVVECIQCLALPYCGLFQCFQSFHCDFNVLGLLADIAPWFLLWFGHNIRIVSLCFVALLKWTTSRRLADRKVEKFEKNIKKRGAVPETATKKGSSYPVGPILLGFFIFVVIGSYYPYSNQRRHGLSDDKFTFPPVSSGSCRVLWYYLPLLSWLGSTFLVTSTCPYGLYLGN
ncbi:hypothetical protein RHMOL_Rhmol12G0208000 [Rhododendron molle]|uniref:Uncharacterized protein n=1 Tax=Rhododendron molle TaxID=49168 RepID=A0ACC0LKW2_RHOML|nr:hypothetical protein RHMOL_Rhmol12G0208000 [Rhododendron molle]